LIDALRRIEPEVPPYGTRPTVFLDALSRSAGLRGIDLDAPASRKDDAEALTIHKAGLPGREKMR
jgi:hypothetical protein